MPRLEVYDPKSDTWSSGTDMPTARTFFAAAVTNGQLFVIGGQTNDDFGPFVPTNEVYTPSRTRRPSGNTLGK